MPIEMQELRRFVGGYVSQVAAARALKISPSFLNAVLKGHKPITDKMLKRFGLKRVTRIEAL